VWAILFFLNRWKNQSIYLCDHGEFNHCEKVSIMSDAILLTILAQLYRRASLASVRMKSIFLHRISAPAYQIANQCPFFRKIPSHLVCYCYKFAGWSILSYSSHYWPHKRNIVLLWDQKSAEYNTRHIPYTITHKFIDKPFDFEDNPVAGFD